jgi:hypothetical protein
VRRSDGEEHPPQRGGDILLGAGQEWTPLLHEPGVPWSSKTVVEWIDTLGNRRGRPALEFFAAAAQGSRDARAASVFLTHGYFVLEHVLGQEVEVWGEEALRVRSWVLQKQGLT